MIRLRLLFVALALVLPSSLAAQEGGGPTESTAAGMPVIYERIAGNEVVAVRLYLKGGSANLTPSMAGIENFMTSAATRGTEKYSRDAFAARLAATGTEITAEANPDYTVISLKAVGEHWDEAWDLFTEAVLRPAFPPEEVDLVRDQIVNQLKGRLDNPDAYLRLLANELFYEGHPYAIDPLGTVETIEAITVEELARWHRERMTRENLVFVVVGNVSRDDVEGKIESAFGEVPATGGSALPIPAVVVSDAEIEVTERQLPTNYIRGHFATPDPGHADYPAMRVALDILSDRLFEEVRTKRNLSYAVAAQLSQRRANYGLLYVTAVEPDTTIKVMMHEVERLKAEPMTDERLQENVNVFLTQYWLGQETNMGKAAALGGFEMTGGGWENAGSFVRRVRAVTPEDIQRVARTYLKSVRFVVLGDPAKFDRALFTSL
jgi:zinc protease